MNILQLTVDYPPPLTGGIPRQVSGLSQALAARHTVGVIASGPNRQDGPVRVFGADPLPVALPSTDMTHLARVNFGLVKGLVEANGENTWDIVHAHDWMVAPAAVFANEVLGIPVVASIHTDAGSATIGTSKDQLRRLDWESSLARSSSLLMAVSTPVRDLLVNRYPHVPARYLPNGINPSRFVRPAVQRQTLRILFVGRLVPYKGCQDAIQAVAHLKADWPGIELEIVGDGFFRRDLETLVHALGLDHSVTFCGWNADADLIDAYGRATIVVVPSHEEAFGIVAIEAMAAGCPVVATSIPGFESYIDHGSTGMLAAPRDPVDLARQLDRLLQDAALRSTLARNAFQKIVPGHEWATVLQSVEYAYQAVLRGD